MAKSSYYYQRAAQNKTDKYVLCRAKNKSLFHENRGIYGCRRIHIALKREGITVSEKVIRRIMWEENPVVSMPKQKKYNSYLGEITPEAENVISRNFHADKSDEKWLTDITKFALPCGKMYLSPIIDCFDGMVVSWAIGSNPNAALVNTMLDQAIAGLMCSMSKKGSSPDNAACEGFFGRLKNEMFFGRSWSGVSLEFFAQELDSYIHWYNHKQIKLSLGGLNPFEFRPNLGFTT